MALSSLSNPEPALLDVLNKYSHDNDVDVAHNAILALGLVGAGSNNARLATMLRQLAAYHAKNPSHLFLVRISQGLVHLGKVSRDCSFHFIVIVIVIIFFFFFFFVSFITCSPHNNFPILLVRQCLWCIEKRKRRIKKEKKKKNQEGKRTKRRRTKEQRKLRDR